MKTQWQVSRPRCFKKLRFDAKPRQRGSLAATGETQLKQFMKYD